MFCYLKTNEDECGMQILHEVQKLAHAVCLVVIQTVFFVCFQDIWSLSNFFSFLLGKARLIALLISFSRKILSKFLERVSVCLEVVRLHNRNFLSLIPYSFQKNDI